MADPKTIRKAADLLATKLVQAIRRGDDAIDALRQVKALLVDAGTLLDQILDEELQTCLK